LAALLIERMRVAIVLLGLCAACSPTGDSNESRLAKDPAAMAVDSRQEERPATPPRLVLLVSLDTLRADRLGLYGHTRFTSPTLDLLATEGVVFEDASTPAPWTLPAHASMLTGRTPASHGVMRSKTPLVDSVPTLASMLAAAGYETAAVVSVDWLGQEPFAVTRDFERFRFHETPLDRRSPSTLVTDTAGELVDAAAGRPLFLFVHYYDLHTDYASEASYESLFVEPYEGAADGTGLQLQQANLPSDYIAFCAENPGIKSCEIGYLEVDGSVERVEFDERARRHLLDLYDAGVRQLDTELSRLLSMIRTKGLYDDMLIVVTSDHGEEFGEHGLYEHMLGLHQEVLRVPLILAGPSVPRGVRIGAPVSIIDIVPTVLGIVGAEPPADVEGFDLAPLWRAGDDEVTARSFASRSLPGEASGALQFDDVSRPYLPFRRTLRRDRYKLVREENSKRLALYDLVADPGEQVDVAAHHPVIVRELLAELEQRSLGLARPTDPRIELDPEEAARLRALGYVP